MRSDLAPLHILEELRPKGRWCLCKLMAVIAGHDGASRGCRELIVRVAYPTPGAYGKRRGGHSENEVSLASLYIINFRGDGEKY